MPKHSHMTFLFAIAIMLGGCDSQRASRKDQPSAYPAKTVAIVCPWAAGGGTDRLSRFMADQLQQGFDGSPFVVQNRTGGSGVVGHSAGARAQPDGHTILMATFELSTMHWMGITDLTWQDYDWIAQLNADPAALIVKADASWKDLPELLDHIKANPKQVTLSGTATGGAWDLARAGMMMSAGLPVDSVIWSPTKGSAPAIVELLGGHVDVVCCSVPEAAAQIDSGELRVLVVMQEPAEDSDVVTCHDHMIDWTAVGWRGLAVPKGTPPDVVEQLTTKVKSIAESQEFQDFMTKNGFNIEFRAPSDFSQFLKDQDAQWQQVIQAAGYAK